VVALATSQAQTKTFSPPDRPSTYSRSIEHKPSEVALLDGFGTIVAINAAWRTAGREGEIVAQCDVGRAYAEAALRFLPKLSKSVLARNLSDLFAGRRAGVDHGFAVDTPGGPRWRQINITPLRLGGGIEYMAMHDDLTELARAQDDLRRVSDQLLSVQDDERQRIAIDLHDSTVQHLAALGLGLVRLRALVHQANAREVIDDMSLSFREAVQETRVLSYLMKPTRLLLEGLEVTARAFVQGFASRTAMEVNFVASGDVDGAPDPIQHAAFRVIQEALSNAYRHAAAGRVDVGLHRDRQMLRVTIGDDGHGISGMKNGEEATTLRLGVGIPGMRVRVEQLGGRLDILSDASGTQVVGAFPLGDLPR
jgi:signal transduction histidine kinase